MSGDDQSWTGVFEWVVAALVASAAGWSAAQLAPAWSAAGAAMVGALLAVATFAWTGRRRRFRLPPFAVPAFPAAEQVEDDGVVVRLHRTPRLATAGELEGRIRAHLAGQRQSAEVIPLKADASAALRDALVGLKDARR